MIIIILSNTTWIEIINVVVEVVIYVPYLSQTVNAMNGIVEWGREVRTIEQI